MKWSLKPGVIVACIVFSAGVLHSHSTGSFFPVYPVSVVVASAVLYATLSAYPHRLIYGLIAFTGLAVIYRAYLFLAPASMLQLDPDAHAVRSQIIVETGHLSGIVPDFYSAAPIFHILGSETALLAGLSIEDAYVIFPVIAGISMSLFAAILAKRVIGRSRAAIGAAAIGAVSASTIKYSIGPIPMTLAAMYIAGCVIALMLYHRNARFRYLFILGVFAFASAFTHKIPVLLIVAILGSLAIYSKMIFNILGEKLRTTSSILLGLGIILLSLQWVYTSDFTIASMRLISGIILAAETSAQLSQPNPAAAVFIDSSVFVKLRDLAYYFVSTGFAALVGAHLFRYADSRNVRIIQAAALVTVAITLPSLVLGTSPGFKRVFVYGSIFVAVLIAVGAEHLSELPFPNARRASVFIVIVVLIVNPMSVVATPDYPGSHRTYFTQQEVGGKHFLNDRVAEEVYLDMYFGDEVFDFPGAAKAEDQHQRMVPNVERYPTLMSQELIEGTLLNQSYAYVGLRTDVEIYRLKGGRYRLTWNPESALNLTYHRIYSNDGFAVYRDG